jgi:hypothetical protein
MKTSHRFLVVLLLAASPAIADLQIHTLPRDQSREVADALKAVLPALCHELEVECAAENLPDGQLLIEAPAGVQGQVAAVIRSIEERNAGPTPRLTLNYWVISGVRGAPDSDPAALRPLGSVLAQLERLNGELGFSVVDKRSVTSNSGGTASLAGSSWNIEQDATVIDTQLNARIMFQLSLSANGQDPSAVVYNQRYDAEVTLDRGEFLVLSEASASNPVQDDMFFVVVHWPEAE